MKAILADLRTHPIKIIAHIGALTPLIWLIWAYLSDNLTVNPIQAATQRTGDYAIVLLTLSLAVTPLYTITRIRQIIPLRRLLGLYAFIYAAMHFAIFIGWDYGFDWGLVIPEIFAKQYTVVGLVSGIILLALAITSFKWWMKRLGKNWKRLHQLVYAAGILVVIHFAWARKGDILRLTGDIQQPLILGAVVLLLLFLRLPPVRKWVSNSRRKLPSLKNHFHRAESTSPLTKKK